MTQVCKIILVRHGESVFNRQGIIAGNSPLTPEGREQARQTKKELAGFSFDAFYSSDLIRAAETAEIIAGKALPKANKLPGLRERDFGSLDMKPSKHHDDDHNKRVTLTQEENWAYKHVDDMESDHELASRFIGVLQELAEKNAGKTILVAAHGAAIRTTLMKLLGLTYHEIPHGSFKNAGYVELTYADNKFKVVHAPGVRI
jgi:probable phosphoglycerate mutase